MNRLFVVGFVCLSATAATAAGSMTISQKDNTFSEKKVTIAAGESITFSNEDEVTHNIHSQTEGSEFDSGSMKPGENFTQTFANAGKVKVRCAIHPKMKMTVMVE